MGADISYECIDPLNRVYKVTVNFYRDCAGIDAPNNISLNVTSLTCGQNFNVDLQRIAAQPHPYGGLPGEVSPLCPSVILQSSCNGGNLPGVQTFAYVGIVTLPMACTDWTFSINIAARNDLITNLLNASSQALHVATTVNNVAAVNNNSLVFTTLPVPFICVNQPFSYNHGAVDADGDSLVFSLVNALGFGGVPIVYNFPFTPTSPMTTIGGFNFNTTTGQLNFTPSGLQVAVVTVLVSEYRNGILIGTTMRDIQIVVMNIAGCNSPAPKFSGNIASTVQGGYSIDTSLVQVCPGSQLTFSVRAFDRNGDSLFLESNMAQSIPGALFNITRNAKDTVTGNFSWTPSGTDTGRHTFIVVVSNNHCPLANSQAYALTIDVLTGTTAGPDLYYCPSGGPVRLQAYGGSQFTWRPTLFLSNPNAANPFASPNQTVTYVVTSNVSSTCKNTDSVTVFRVPDFDFTISQSKDTICLYDIVQFQVTGDSTNAPYKYEWTPSTGMNATDIANPYAKPTSSTAYQLRITSLKTGCSQKDTAMVVVGGGRGPFIMLSADKNNVCSGDTIHIDSYISTVSCGANTTPCTGTNSTFVTGTDTLRSAGGSTPYNNFYTSGRIQMIFLASELRALGVQPGTITAVSFEVATKRSTQPFRNFTIRMGCTERSFMSGFVNTGLTEVYFNSGFITTPGFNTHTLNTPFSWDGISNLMMDVCFTNNQYSQDDIVRFTRTDFNSITYAGADALIGCNLPGPNTIVTTSSNRPNVRFNYCTPPAPNITYSWTPSSNVFSPNSPKPFIVMGSNSETYILSAQDSTCQGAEGVRLNIDTSYKISAGPDVAVCDGIPIRLNAGVAGFPPRENIEDCRLSAGACNETPVQRDLNRDMLLSSVNTMFAGASNGTVRSARTQILYLASDLIAAGFTRGTINKIGFRLASKATVLPFRNLNIGLGCTGNVDLTDAVWEPVTNVFSTPSYSTVTTWNEFTLQNNFEWDGKKNLVVEICWNMTDTAQTATDPILVSSSNYNALHIGTSDTATGCNIPARTFRLYRQLPELRMTICPPPLLPVTYQWQPTTGLSNDTITNPFVNPSQRTSYVITAYFGGKCPKTDTIIVTPKTVVPVVSVDTTLCLGNSAELLASGGDRYQWSPADSLSCINCSNPIANPSATTTYYVTVTDAATGCSKADSTTVIVQELTVTPFFADTLVDAGTTVTLGADVTGGNGQYSYFWYPGTYLDNASTPSPVSAPLADIIYTLLVTSGPCIDSTQITVRVDKKDDLVVMPNAFTPNGDGKNDSFGPVTQLGIATIKTFRIYNRYGQLVHNSTNEWDGTFNGTPQPAGTYVYYITMQVPLYADKTYSGSVTLLR